MKATATRNPTIELLLGRKSIRDYEDRHVPEEIKDQVISSALRASTAGNMMLYHIIEVEDAARREFLSHSCDEQPFIAKAPWILVFVADYQRWYDYFSWSGAEAGPGRSAAPRPAEADLLLAISDAIIAAQSAATAADALGLGSCYIGDIMENYEKHREFFGLPRWAFPVAMLTIGWPTERQRAREQPRRFDRRFIVSKERYRKVEPDEYGELFGPDPTKGAPFLPGASNCGQHVWTKKFSNPFMDEMRRSVRAALAEWVSHPT